MRQRLKPARVSPPGKILKRELEASNLTHQDLVNVSEDLPETIEQIIEGGQSIDDEIAFKLSQLFQTSSTFWLNLESNYRLYLAEKAIEQSVK